MRRLNIYNRSIKFKHLLARVEGDRTLHLAHRLIWEDANGPIPEGYLGNSKEGVCRLMTITLREAIDDCWSRSKCADGQEGKYYHAWKVLYSFLDDRKFKDSIKISAEQHKEALERLANK